MLSEYCAKFLVYNQYRTSLCRIWIWRILMDHRHPFFQGDSTLLPPQGPIETPPPRFPFGTPPSPPRPLGVPSQWGKKKFQSGLTPPASSSPPPSLGPLRGPFYRPFASESKEKNIFFQAVEPPLPPPGAPSGPLPPPGAPSGPLPPLGTPTFNEWRAFNGFLAYLWPKLNWLNKKKKKKQTISNLITFSIGRNFMTSSICA